MHGVVFEEQAPPAPPSPHRADVALFVGFVGRRPGPVPAQTRAWLAEQGWVHGPHRRAPEALESLFDVPVPLDGWETFDRLFAWDARPLDRAGTRGAGYLGAAVRSFFAQGGRRCYVVRAGCPWRYTETAARRARRLRRLVPGLATGDLPVAADRRSWRGVGHLFGLPDVSFLCLPDLADLLRPDPEPVLPLPLPVGPEEAFSTCAAEDATAARPLDTGRAFPAPRLDEAAFERWAHVVRTVGRWIARNHREVQLVAALPLAAPSLVVAAEGTRAAAQDDPLRHLRAAGWLSRRLADGGTGLASAFVQLAYPWARTAAAGLLPEGLEGPDGLLCGVLARGALLRGTWRSAAGSALADAWDVHPAPGRDALLRPQPYAADAEEGRSLVERVSVLGETAEGLRLLSDVTTALDEAYRPAGVARLVSALVRAARREGDDAVFEPSGERAWARLRARLETLLLDMLRAGALRGATASDAFDVRCDRTTMSQNDLDHGRIVARVVFRPAAPVERITVVLAAERGGGVALRTAEAA